MAAYTNVPVNYKKSCIIEIWFWITYHTAFLFSPMLGDCFRIDTTYCITHIISCSTWVFLGMFPFKMWIIPDPDLFAIADMIIGWGAVAMGHGHIKALFSDSYIQGDVIRRLVNKYDQMGFLKKQNFLNDFLVVNELTNFQLGLICVISLNTQDPHNFF